MATETKNVAAAWQTRAHWLARWTLARLVNRTDVWGRHLPREKWKAGTDGEMIRTRLGPVPSKRGKLRLSEAALARHFRGADGGHVLGIHGASEKNTSKWIAIELDGHEGRDGVATLKAAAHWRDELVGLGFRPLLIDTDGRGSYLLLVLFRDALPTARAHDFAEALVRDAEDLGLADRPKIHPTDSSYDESDWLRLPGRHPQGAHWSRVWHRNRWAEGPDAVEALLQAHGDSPTLIRKLAMAAGRPGSPESGARSARPSEAGEAADVPHYTADGDSSQTSIHTHSGDIPIQGIQGRKSAKHAKSAMAEKAPREGKPSYRAEEEILCYLLAATRAGQEADAFDAVRASDISAEAFAGPVHRHIYQAIEKLRGKNARITPTTLADEIPEPHRQSSLALIDKLILEHPVDADKFEKKLARLSQRVDATEVSGKNQDGQLRTLIDRWPELPPAIRQAIMTLAMSNS